MKAFSNYEQAKENAKYEGGERLPEGGYVCRILGTKYANPQNGNSGYITMEFDIAEGEHAGFFQKQYEANTSEDRKFKGKVIIWEPKDDGTEQDGWTKNTFARWTNAIEDSNPGYSWDWDETKWKGKLVGILFGTTGTVIDGKEITYTEARTAVNVEKVRSGDYKIPKFKSKNGYTGKGNAPSGNSGNSSNSGSDDWMNVTETDMEQLPF